MDSLAYTRYITSDRWMKRRRKYFRDFGAVCFACGVRKHLHLHHLSYANLRNEPDDDLMALCQFCHTKVHQDHAKSKLSLREATHIVVTRIRSDKERAKAKTERRALKKAIENNEQQHVPKNNKRKKNKKPVPSKMNKPDFIPQRQRLTLAQRKAETLSGTEGRLSGLPIVYSSQPRVD